MSYAGQSATTCNTSNPLPTNIFSNSYQYAVSSLPITLTTPSQIFSTGSTAAINWSYAQPCQGYNADMNVTETSGPLLANTWMTISQGSNRPAWKLQNLTSPNSGSGSVDYPIGFPFDRILTYYENSDQDTGIMMGRGPYMDSSKWYTLSGGLWYQVSYSLSPAKN